MDLLLDIKIMIATALLPDADIMADVAFKLYLCDDEFRDYIRTKEGAQIIANEATVIRYTPKTPLYYAVTECFLFGRRHRNSIVDGIDLPAYECTEWREWIYNGKRHRKGDKPALIIGCAGDNDNEMMWFKYGILYKYTIPTRCMNGRFTEQKNLVSCVNDSKLAYLHQ